MSLNRKASLTCKPGSISKIIFTLLLAAAVAVTPLAAFLPGGAGAPIRASAGPGTIDPGAVDCAYICSELGLLRGEGAGVTDEYLAKTTLRVQAAYLTLRLVGKESEAEKFTGADNFNDVGHIYEGGQRRTAYLKAHSAQYGWQGDGTNRLMPDDPVTAQQFYKVLLTVLGYQANVDYPYADTLDYADRTAKLREYHYIAGPLTNDDIAVMLVEALLAYVRDETYTLAEFLAEEGVIDYEDAVELGVIGRTDIIETVPEPEPSAPDYLTVDSITATNFAEIDIVFNQKIDPDSVDRNYIMINGGPLLATDYLRVLDDGVTLRIYRENGFVTSQGVRVNVSINKVCAAATAAGAAGAAGPLVMGAVSNREISVFDNQTPFLEGVTAIGLRRVKIVFSEPIRTSDSAVKNYTTYKFNGRVMPASDAAVCNGREIYLNFSTPLEAGQNKLTIDPNRIYDLAGFPILDVTDYLFTAEEDKEVPQVLNVDAWREKVTVTFSKEVRDQVRLYWLDGNVRRTAQAAEKDPFDRNVVTFRFAEGQYLPVSSTELVIEGIVDMNGNTAADYRTGVIPKYDTDRPAVVSVESSGANAIAVCFSKAVKLGSSNNGRFTLKNSNNVTVTVSVQAYTPEGASASDPRYILLTGAIPSGTYTLTVSGVEDTTAQANKSTESVHSVVVMDKDPPLVLSVSVSIPESKVVIVFDKELDWNSATDIVNYQYNVPGRGHVDVPTGSSAYLEGDGRTVVLTFPAGGWALPGNSQNIPNAFSLYVATNASDELRVLNIKDKNGNAMNPTVIDVPGSNEVAAKLLPAAYATSTLRIMMRFESTGSLPINAASQDFYVRAGSQNLYFRNMSYNSINTTLRELYFDIDSSSELNTDGTYGMAHTPVTVSMVTPNQVSYTKTALGTPLEIQGGAAVQVTDNIRPGLLEAYRGNRASATSAYASGVTLPALTRNQVLIVFDEPVQLQGVANAAQLVNILDVRLESQPNSTISPSYYTAEAFDDRLNVSSSTGTAVTRMLIVTFVSTINEAVNVSVRANSLSDGNRDANGFNVMNEAFDTGFLGAVS